MQIINNTGAIIKEQINLGNIDNLNIDDLFKDNTSKKMKNKKVTIDELGITVTYQVRFNGEVTEKVAQQLQAMYKEGMVYSEEDDLITNHPYEEAIELVTDLGIDGVPLHYTYEIDSLEFSEELP
jgi:hypothetical protein